MRNPVIIAGMSQINDCPSRLLRAKSVVFRRAGALLSSPGLLSDADALLYSARSFAAAMLAYYLALSIGLERPSWAIITVYIVSQTSVGASLSRCVYRLIGTIAGAGATVLIVPAFVNTPLVCSAVLAGWITFCLYLSLLERTPRAYAYLLAGYTASLIGFPAVLDPGAIFDVAITRVQEIAIGIFCAALVHRYVLPKRLSGLFNSKVAETLRAVRQTLAHALTGKPDEAAGSLQLALALQFLQGVNHHLPYDFAIPGFARNGRKAIHDRLAQLLVVSCELRDRLQPIGAIPGDLQQLLEDVKTWLACEEAGQRKIAGDALAERSARLTARLAADAQTFVRYQQVSLARHLQQAIILLQQCERLADAIRHAQPAQIAAESRAVTGYVFHRDGLSAARTALGAFTIIASGCAVWIYSAWPDGGTAVSILGVCCTLFGSFDTPAPHIVKYIVGSAYGVAASLIYSFVLLPQITDFSVLAAALAPVYLLAGSLQARPPTTFMAMGITLTLPILCELGPHYSGDFAVAINTAIALFAATGFAVASMRVLQTVQADSAINRLLRICRRDVRRSLKGTFAPDEAQWTNLMIDRTALLLPRLPRSRQSSGQALNHMLHHLRVGRCVMRLRRLRLQMGSEAAKEINALFSRLACGEEAAALRPRILAIVDRYAPATDGLSRRLTDELVDLHCALSEQNRKLSDDE